VKSNQSAAKFCDWTDSTITQRVRRYLPSIVSRLGTVPVVVDPVQDLTGEGQNIIFASSSMNEAGRTVVDREKVPSPLNFQWNNEDPFADAKGRDMLSGDPFMEGNDGNEGSLGGDEPVLRSDLLEDSANEGVSLSTAPGGASGGEVLNSNSERSQEKASRKRTVASSSKSSAPSRRKKKPKGMPKRPLSAYNLFFQSQRVKILDENGDAGNRRIGFEELGRVIGKKWKSLSTGERKIYVKLAEKDNIRYRKEMDAYNELKTKKLEEADKLAPLDFEEQATIGRAGAHGRQQDMGPPSFRSQPQQPKFLHVDGGFATASGHSAPNASFSGELARQSIPGVPLMQQVSLVGSYPPSVTEVPQGQYRSQYIVEHGLQRAPSTVAASGAPMGGSHYTTSIPIQQPPPSHPNSFPVPPGMEMTLNQGGTERKYRVQYTCYSMSKDAALQYVDSLVSGGPNTGRPSVPPNPPNHG
jgi:hypothetical protein